MGIVSRLSVLVALWVAVFAGRARAAGSPLLVAVEVAPGIDIRPRDVRETVAAEIGTPVVGAWEPTPADDVLLVALEPREIRMSLHVRSAPVVMRAIDAPTDRPGRLRSIAWLAGNLVRDQVGPIVASASTSPSAADARPATEPPPVQAPESPVAAAPAAIASSSLARRQDPYPHATWAVTAAGGGSLSIQETLVRGVHFGNTFKIEARHQTSPESLFYGMALEVGPDVGVQHDFGGTAFVGSDWRRRWFFLEGDLGLGIEALTTTQIETTYMTLPDGSVVNFNQSTTVEHSPGLYARFQGTAGVRVAAAFDVVAQLGLHLSSTGGYGSFVGSMVGVRLRLP